MYGVVLWSDRRENRAVIWCEDHGDLAYYDGGEAKEHAKATLDPGDLVRFDVSEGKRMRIVSNPQVVASEQYPSLAGDLAREGARHGADAPCEDRSNRDAGSGKGAVFGKIVPLDPHRRVAAMPGKIHRSTG